jgi:hypothetical protein
VLLSVKLPVAAVPVTVAEFEQAVVFNVNMPDRAVVFAMLPLRKPMSVPAAPDAFAKVPLTSPVPVSSVSVAVNWIVAPLAGVKVAVQLPAMFTAGPDAEGDVGFVVVGAELLEQDTSASDAPIAQSSRRGTRNMGGSLTSDCSGAAAVGRSAARGPHSSGLVTRVGKSRYRAETAVG